MGTIAVAGIWELGWSAPVTESDMWRMVLKEFGIDRLNMTPVSGIAKRWIDEFSSFEEILKANKELTPVFVDEKGATELREFVHPQDALYVFGKVSFSPFSDLAKGHTSLRIDAGARGRCGCLWPHQALSVVLYDRAGKNDDDVPY